MQTVESQKARLLLDPRLNAVIRRAVVLLPSAQEKLDSLKEEPSSSPEAVVEVDEQVDVPWSGFIRAIGHYPVAHESEPPKGRHGANRLSAQPRSISQAVMKVAHQIRLYETRSPINLS